MNTLMHLNPAMVTKLNKITKKQIIYILKNHSLSNMYQQQA